MKYKLLKENTGQSSLELLLILGGAIVIAVIVGLIIKDLVNGSVNEAYHEAYENADSGF